MAPIQLRIGSKIARSADNTAFSGKSKCLSPQVAFVEMTIYALRILIKNVLEFTTNIKKFTYSLVINSF